MQVTEEDIHIHEYFVSDEPMYEVVEVIQYIQSSEPDLVTLCDLVI